MKSIDEALARTEPIVAAWDLESMGDDHTLSVFSLAGVSDASAPYGSRTLKQLAYASFDREERDRAAADLAARGVVIGLYDLGSGVVWRSDAERFSVWGRQGPALDATRDRLTLGDGTALSADEVYEVVAFVDADRVRRGVSLRRGEEEWVLVEAFQHAAAGDPTYDEMDALADAAWARALGRNLAKWLGGKFRDQT